MSSDHGSNLELTGLEVLGISASLMTSKTLQDSGNPNTKALLATNSFGLLASECRDLLSSAFAVNIPSHLLSPEARFGNGIAQWKVLGLTRKCPVAMLEFSDISGRLFRAPLRQFPLVLKSLGRSNSRLPILRLRILNHFATTRAAPMLNELGTPIHSTSST